MLQNNTLIVFRAFGDDENDEPGAQNTSIQDSPEFQEALKTHLAQAVEKETAGLKNKLSEILGEKKTLSERLNQIASQAEDEQDQAALKAGKLDMQTLMDKKIAARDQTWQEKMQAEQAEKEELRSAVKAGNDRLKQFQIKQFVINEALKNEFFHASAAEDLALMASGSWDLTESGDLISRDRDGNIAIGKNGRALTPKEWIEDIQKVRPHYFKTMSGSGSKPGNGGVKSFTRAEWQKAIMTATPKEEKALFEARAKGEFTVTQ